MFLTIRYEVRQLYRWALLLLSLLFWFGVLAGAAATGWVLFHPSETAFWLISIPMWLHAAWANYARRKLLEGRQSGWVNACILTAMSLPSLFFPLAIVAILQLLDEKKRDRFSALIREREALEAKYAPSPGMPLATANWLVGGGLALAAMLFVANYLHESGQVAALQFSRPAFRVDQNMSVPELYETGRACNSDGDSRCAAAIFARIQQLDPGDMTALANLGMAQTQMGEHEQARESYKTYFARGGGGVDTMAYYARTLNALNDKTGALEWNMRALRAAPNLIDVAQQVTSLLIEMHEEEKAIQFIDGFIKKNPTATSYFENIRGQLGKRKPVEPKEAI